MGEFPYLNNCHRGVKAKILHPHLPVMISKWSLIHTHNLQLCQFTMSYVSSTSFAKHAK